MDLQLCNKVPKRWVKAKLRNDRKDTVQINKSWTMDSVHDQLDTGTKFRILPVVDTFSRFLPVIDPKISYWAEDIVATLERVCTKIG